MKTSWQQINKFFLDNPITEQEDKGLAYAWDVVYTEKYITSAYIFKACKRHLLFYYHSLFNPKCDFFYNKNYIKMAYAFYSLFIIPETRQPYIFTSYRAFMLSAIFGFCYKSNPKKFITEEVFDIEARKQGKSLFYAILNLFFLCGLTGDNLTQNYICGAGEKSSLILYKLTANLINFNPIVKKEFVKNNRDIIKHRDGGECVKLPFEKSTLEGQNPTLVILTEYHLHPDNRMQESARTARNASRNNQLIIYDTTKGQNIDFPCFRQEKTFKKMLDYQIEHPEAIQENFNIFLFCAELDEDKYSEWDNPKWWAMANPNLNITIRLDDLIKEFNTSKGSKLDQRDFKIKRVGMWINQTDAFFDWYDIKENQTTNKNIYEEYFKNSIKYKDLNCVLGLDLSDSGDTTALVATFEIPQPDGENIWIIKHIGFIPSATAEQRERIERIPYTDHKLAGFCKYTEGNVIDFVTVADEVQNYCKMFNVKLLGYDRFQFKFIKDHILYKTYLNEDELVDVKQNVYLTPAIKEFERKLKLRKIYIADDNQMLINHILNLSMKPSTNVNNNYKPEKIAFNFRVDGAIAMFTALMLRVGLPAETNRDFNFKIITA